MIFACACADALLFPVLVITNALRLRTVRF
jgi:hypothetical protein